MKTYELTYIVSPQIDSREAETIQHDIASLVQSKEGVVLRSEKMGSQPLSYAIKKQGSGYFNIETFQINEARLGEIKNSLDKNAKILRSVILIKKPVKLLKERRSKKPVLLKDFQAKKKPSIMDLPIREESKRGEKVDALDLDKKLDELLSE